jgi:hypothetical protein
MQVMNSWEPEWLFWRKRKMSQSEPTEVGVVEAYLRFGVLRKLNRLDPSSSIHKERTTK